MTEPININSLFADILPDPAQEMRQQQSDLLSVLGTTGGVAALNAPRQAQQLRAAAGGLFGVDTRTPSEKLREAMQGIDPNNPQDLIRLASMTDSIDPAKAIQMRQAAAQLTAQQKANQEAAITQTRQRNAMMDTVMSIEGLDPAMQNAAISAIEAGSYDGNIQGLMEAITPNKDRFDVKDGAVWDNFKGEWKIPPAADSGALGVEKIDADNYTPESWVAYTEAVAEAKGNPEKLRRAHLYLKFLPPTGWDYVPMKDSEGKPVLDANGIPKQVQKPTGDKLAEYSQRVRAANNAGQVIIDKTGDVLDSLDRIEEAIGEGTETGFIGTFVSYIPETDEYTLRGDIESVLANSGYNALIEARQSSDNGSSGFGQLTEKEFDALKSLVTRLKQGMKKEDFVERLAALRKGFERTRSRAKTDWTVDQWIGVEQLPEIDEDSIVAPSGSRFTVELVEENGDA